MTTSENRNLKGWHGWLVLLAIFMLAFGLRWYYVSTAVVLNPVRGDATQYYAYALNLANHGVFSKDLPDATLTHPDNYRDPGYPVFLALWMKMLGFGDTWYIAVLLSQALLGALTVTLATQLGRHWLPLRWATAAGLLMAVWPHSITINGYLLSETLFDLLLVLGMLAVASALQRQSLWRTVIAGITLGAAALTNAILLPFGILLAALLAQHKLASRKLCVALAIGALALPGAWFVRNAVFVVPVAGNSSTDRALLNLVQGSWPGFQSAWRDLRLGNEAEQTRARAIFQSMNTEYTLLQTSPLQGARSILRRFSQHPLQFARWYLVDKPALLWGWGIEIGQGDIFIYPTKNAPFQIQPAWIALVVFCHAFNTVLMLLALASVLCIWSRAQRLMTWEWQASRAVLVAVICLLAFVTLVYSTLQAEPRYSIPFRPFEILLAITTLRASAVWWQRRKHEVHAARPASAIGAPDS
ncbi:glycosyltransferase family 39 protein [Rhodanobacter sp. C05]|uniref:ArnT family glycosyltransferase n=1 Tax=Rhodanobacter sp. C05 TaxID=1945855 RepID=UPI0009850EF4|nr:glycosyltransferase family 39 protein [Rhodanobacter sp. C05]OOG42488.1 hypothetical protein B0E51_03165 [Rhodanobacter sp. C05]